MMLHVYPRYLASVIFIDDSMSIGQTTHVAADSVRLRLVQQVVEDNLADNVVKIEEQISSAAIGEWLVFPEAALSGYAPERSDYLDNLDPTAIRAAIRQIAEHTTARDCVCILGSAIPVDDGWLNAALIMANGEIVACQGKRQLSALDRNHFTPDTSPSVKAVADVSIGIQLCRELLFPGTWSELRSGGAKMIIHLNNAIKPKDAVWEHLLISRAVENACYVCSVNNGAHPQALGSFVIGPDGKKLVEIEPLQLSAASIEISLSAIQDDVLGRTDF
jgi:predicted amidohydrolase